MGLIKCPDCGKMVSERAVACPNCGCPRTEFELQEQRNEIERRRVETEQDLIKQQQLEADRIKEIKETLKGISVMCYDWESFVETNDCIANDIRKRINLPYEVCVISSQNIDDYLNAVDNNIFKMPCIVVLSNFRYYLGAKTNTTYQINGETVTRYLDLFSFPGFLNHIIKIFANNEETLREIYYRLIELYESPIEFCIKDINYPNEFDVFKCRIKHKDKFDVVYSIFNDDNYFMGCATLDSVQCDWVHSFNEKNIKIRHPYMRTLRLLQLAQCLCLCLLYKVDVGQQINLYASLRKRKGVFEAMFEPIYSEAYEQLRRMVSSSKIFDEKLVDEAFPHLTIIYHNLFSDIINNVPANEVKEKVDKIFEDYTNMFNDICDYLNIPEDLGIKGCEYSKYENTMRCNDALLFCLNAIGVRQDKTIEDMVIEYKNMVEKDITMRYHEAKMRKALKQDLIGSAGCAKNNGRSCKVCNIRGACSRYN